MSRPAHQDGVVELLVGDPDGTGEITVSSFGLTT
jgi:hypothetical protein